jgi:hypothetical protein
MPMRLRLVQLFIAGLVVGLPVTGYALTLRSPQHAARPASPIARRVAIAPSPSPVATATPGPFLSADQLFTVEGRLALIVDQQNPRVALAELTHLMDTNPGVLRSCHAIAHSVGHAAYAKYRDFATAVQYQDDICGSGYLHGVVESRFASVKDIYAEMGTICDAYIAINQGGKCLHGVGHGLMRVTNNNLPRSIQLCDTYSLDIFKIRCSEGVFMENFGTDLSVHFSRYLRRSDPMYPCAQQTDFYKGTCYFYAPLFYLDLHDGRYLDALHWCDGAEVGYVAACVAGTGSRIMKQNIRRPRYVEHLCDQAGAGRVAPCIDGMVSYFLVNFNSFRKGVALCAEIDSIDRPTCNASLETRRAIFPP